MKRGEIYIADLNPTMGSEINKKRPVIIVSNNINNFYSDTVTIIPITSNINKVYHFEVFIKSIGSNGLSNDSKAQCHQVRTISKVRISSAKLGSISTQELEALENALRLHLEL